MWRIEAVPGGYGFGDIDIVHSTSHGRFGWEADEAVERFRRALELDPGVVEARVRLGRVQWLLDRRDEAEAELLHAVREASDRAQPAILYLASLFLGRLYEDADDAGRASAAYQAAREARPDGQAAGLALARLWIVSGRGPEGWHVARAVLARARSSPPAVDPWRLYETNQHGGPEGVARYRALRARIRQ